MPQQVDPKLVKLVRQVDQERQGRLKAEQRERALRLQLLNTKRRLGLLARTTDAKPERGASC